jgi:hypothetical protein
MSLRSPEIHLCFHCWKAIVGAPDECCSRCAEELQEEGFEIDDDGLPTEPRIVPDSRLMN